MNRRKLYTTTITIGTAIACYDPSPAFVQRQ